MSRGGLFSAAESAVGYLFQCRFALLRAIQGIRSGAHDAVSIETFDDITFDSGGSPAELLQTKHHATPATLSDWSTDVWKTLRIWIDYHQTNSITFGEVALTLVTTARPTAGSAVELLSLSNRDVKAAADRLENAARNSTNTETSVGRSLYLGLDRNQRERLLNAVTVLASEENINSVGESLRREMVLSVREKHVTAFLEMLEGWWYRWCVAHLSGQDRSPMSLTALRNQIVATAEQFEADNLPVQNWGEPDTLDVDADTRLFVLQLKELGLATRSIEHAIRNYYRAFESRSRWAREDLLLVGELEDYERRLIEEWEQLFEAMKQRIATDDERQAREQGFTLYDELQHRRHIPIREKVTDPCIMRGSFHILANSLRVGWHHDFRARLEHLVEAALA